MDTLSCPPETSYLLRDTFRSKAQMSSTSVQKCFETSAEGVEKKAERSSGAYQVRSGSVARDGGTCIDSREREMVVRIPECIVVPTRSRGVHWHGAVHQQWDIGHGDWRSTAGFIHALQHRTLVEELVAFARIEPKAICYSDAALDVEARHCLALLLFIPKYVVVIDH